MRKQVIQNQSINRRSKSCGCNMKINNKASSTIINKDCSTRLLLVKMQLINKSINQSINTIKPINIITCVNNHASELPKHALRREDDLGNCNKKSNTRRKVRREAHLSEVCMRATRSYIKKLSSALSSAR